VRARDIPLFSAWLKRRRARDVERHRLEALQGEHDALVEHAIDGADFRSWQSFYDGDARRRANEVKLIEFADGEFRWRVIWFSTTEVVAWPFRWRDELWHGKVLGQTYLRTPQPSTKAMGPVPLPEMIYVIGRADSAEAAKQRVSSASTLIELRAALANT
jgi:hypothetical protein